MNAKKLVWQESWEGQPTIQFHAYSFDGIYTVNCPKDSENPSRLSWENGRVINEETLDHGKFGSLQLAKEAADAINQTRWLEHIQKWSE